MSKNNIALRRCKNCFMPDTRPGSVFDKQGVCLACRNYEKRRTINWEIRRKELKNLCAKYRKNNGYYDCVIPISGGKDSYMLVYMIKEKMKMNPLLITVGDPFTKTDAGIKNLRNLNDTFNCDHILFNFSTDLFRRVTKIAFEETGEILKFLETAIYTVPIKLAVSLKIPLIVYGENPSYEYGTTDKESHSALKYIKNIFKNIDIDFWLKRGVLRKELNCIIPPTERELKLVKPEPIFMSYFIPWSSTQNLNIAKRYGFRDLYHEWQREGYCDNFEQIDSIAYMVHHWMKYPKFGFNRPTDIASRFVREGIFTLSMAKKVAKENYKLDQRAMDDFIQFCGYTPKQFWDIVERFWNRNLFKKVNGTWKPKFS